MMIAAMLINLVVAAWLYPEFFTHLDFRLVEGNETCAPMQGVFSLISQFYQGGLQLFDRYDLINGAYTQLSVGMYTPVYFLIALGYIILSPLVKQPALFFHHWEVFAYFTFGLLLRTFGTYLLAFYMTKSRLTAVITTVWVNCFCAIALIHLGGLSISMVHDYLPLLLFCLVYYWETRSFKAIVASVLVFLLAVNNGVLYGLGYFYQTLHLFLFDMLIIWFLFQRGRKPLLKDKINWNTVVKVAAVAFVILLPVWFWAQSLVHDFEMAGSGLGGTQGRFNRIYNPVAMMHDPLRYFVSAKDILSHAYDFTVSGWYLNATFVGITSIVLAVIGLTLAKHSYKYVFMTSAVMMGFLNVPSTQGGWMVWAHWIDTVTDPFCFLVRTFHMSLLLWYLTLAIPICLGVRACIAIVRQQFDKIYANRIDYLKGALLGLLAGSFFIPNPQIKNYAVDVLGLFLVFLIVFDTRKFSVSTRIRTAAVLFLVIMGIEFRALNTYIHTPSVDMNMMYWDGLRIKPRIYQPMYSPAVPMVLDYQNPRVLPVRFFYRADSQVIFPLLVELEGMFGQFYGYMPLATRLAQEGSLYVPREKIFKGVDKDGLIQEYIHRDGRIMYMADAAIAPDPQKFAAILASHLDRRVVQAEGGHAELIQNFKDLNLPAALPQNFLRHDYAFTLEKARSRRRPEGMEYQWPLPKDFPKYLATGVLTPDVYLWHCLVNGRELLPAQGALVYPGTFDVNNLRDGYMTVLLSQDDVLGPEPLQLHVLTPAELKEVWRNTEDQFGLTYTAARDGWWVIHMPYDPHWQLFVDGLKTPVTQINHYFIGTPLSAGEHKILLSYWPESPLRALVLLSTLMAWAVMAFVFRTTYRWGMER